MGNLRNRSPDRLPLWYLGALVATVALARSAPSREDRRMPAADAAALHNLPAGATSAGAGPAIDQGRGRHAASPFDLPWAGWKQVLGRVGHRFSSDRIVSFAAAVTFYSLLAIFPAIAALVAIYGMFTDPSQIGNQLSQMGGVLPGGAVDILRTEASRVASQSSGTLSGAFLIGLAISLWSANGGVKGMFDALNVAYSEEEKRSFMKLNAVSLTFTVCTIVFALLAVAVMIVLPYLLGGIGLGGTVQTLVAIGKWPVLLVVVALLLGLLYRFGPSRDHPEWRWLTPGSVFAAVVWLVASILFSWYAANFGSYNKTYGSLGAAVGFMVWIWISSIVVLTGALINAEAEHQTLRDTTVGRPEPLGQRGAAMADTVGQ